MTGNARSVLVVDDNDVNCMVAETMLKLLGCEVVVAKSGHDAVRIAKGRAFNLILMDWQMPEMNGFEAASAIWAESELNKATPMVAVTANAFEDDKKACKIHGFKDVLTKPFDVEALEAMVQKMLS